MKCSYLHTIASIIVYVGSRSEPHKGYIGEGRAILRGGGGECPTFPELGTKTHQFKNSYLHPHVRIHMYAYSSHQIYCRHTALTQV